MDIMNGLTLDPAAITAASILAGDYEVALYKYALSPAQILRHYQAATQ